MKKFKINKRKERGITLIALVVTIIILIILATISINMIVGENGLIAQAEKAKGVYESSVDREQDIMSQYANTIGGVSAPKTVADAVASKTPFAKTTQITDGNGDSMWVPKDFKVVEGESIDTGVVIEDGVGNQFVWVPVPEINDMYDSEHKAGKLYNFSGEGAASSSKAGAYASTPYFKYHEPDIVTGRTSGDGTDYDGRAYNLNKIQEGLTATEFKAELQSKFNDMIKSVGYYKGFYIGRYEISTVTYKAKSIVQQGKEATTNISWYQVYKISGNIAYKNETEKITSVTSSMIWGCQWDATLNWFLRSDPDNTRGVKGYVTDSTGKGWYEDNSEGSKKLTGTPISEKNYNEVNRIWDMAGNVCEWTLEANVSSWRSYRGGYFNDSGSENSVAYRYGTYPTLENGLYLGARVAICVN